MRSSLIVFHNIAALCDVGAFRHLPLPAVCKASALALKSGRCPLLQLSRTQPDGTEICGSCRTALVPRLDGEMLSGDETGPHYTCRKKTFQPESADTEVPFCGRKRSWAGCFGCIEQSIKSHSLRSFLLIAGTGQGKTRCCQSWTGGHVVFCGVARSGADKRRCPAKVRHRWRCSSS